MIDLVSFFSYGIIIFLVGMTPLTCAPIFIANFILNGFITGLLASLFGIGLMASFQYFFGKLLKIKRIKLFRSIKLMRYLYYLALKLEYKLKKISYFEFLLFRLSAIFPAKITNIACGMSNINFSKFLIVTLIAAIPYQILYYFISLPSRKIRLYGENIGLSNIQSLITYVALSSLGILIILFCLKKIKSYNRLKK